MMDQLATIGTTAVAAGIAGLFYGSSSARKEVARLRQNWRETVHQLASEMQRHHETHVSLVGARGELERIHQQRVNASHKAAEKRHAAAIAKDIERSVDRVERAAKTVNDLQSCTLRPREEVVAGVREARRNRK